MAGKMCGDPCGRASRQRKSANRRRGSPTSPRTPTARATRRRPRRSRPASARRCLARTRARPPPPARARAKARARARTRAGRITQSRRAARTPLRRCPGTAASATASRAAATACRRPAEAAPTASRRCRRPYRRGSRRSMPTATIPKPRPTPTAPTASRSGAALVARRVRIHVGGRHLTVATRAVHAQAGVGASSARSGQWSSMPMAACASRVHAPPAPLRPSHVARSCARPHWATSAQAAAACTGHGQRPLRVMQWLHQPTPCMLPPLCLA
mmetsp:Transcript_112083/g.361881  ORF Transcript_112083/g.361881 Transcript_112083/m.361881 type:complete len:272 (+) Transcript_112083:1590-2405(+)